MITALLCLFPKLRLVSYPDSLYCIFLCCSYEVIVHRIVSSYSRVLFYSLSGNFSSVMQRTLARTEVEKIDENCC